MSSSVVHLLRSQTPEAAKVLSDAFSHDPIVTYFLSDDQNKKLNALQEIGEKLLHFGEPHHHIYTTASEVKGVAVWFPPEASSVTLSKLWQFLTSGLLTVPFYVRWDRLIEMLALTGEELGKRQQEVEPHWYLSMLGVSSKYQGQGIGKELLQPVLEQADRDNLPCYLETSTEAAVRFYQRQGFEIQHSGTVGKTLPYWTMKRFPKA
jgi:GNAT superfamily N-acetyltransferase